MAKKKGESSDSRNDTVSATSITPLKAFLTHLLCGIGLVSAFYVAKNIYSINLIDNPAETLRLTWFIEAPIVILLFSLFRKRRNDSFSYLRAVTQGLLALPAGAVVNTFGAIVLGAPFIHHLPRTLHWSLLMSVLTFVPAASVFGNSWSDWHRIFARAKVLEAIDFMICLPAHGAVIGAWFGAWPMPLDWERPWQEWPICVSYGAIVGYFIGMVASLGFIIVHKFQQHVKGD
ncbi:hypothetical protein M9H77_29175 [Catharanthus roseus]|uniref:Uncharacterized protein n=1 Tax=Catharanthus roseus TaxID=4058 RepID=A0ACC0AIU6_CATRO|nr:hypothetical protein M9H77_29175 [Catharanthus roseus]